MINFINIQQPKQKLIFPLPGLCFASYLFHKIVNFANKGSVMRTKVPFLKQIFSILCRQENNVVF